jgi:ketosteroid isomerase-like protein
VTISPSSNLSQLAQIQTLNEVARRFLAARQVQTATTMADHAAEEGQVLVASNLKTDGETAQRKMFDWESITNDGQGQTQHRRDEPRKQQRPVLRPVPALGMYGEIDFLA